MVDCWDQLGVFVCNCTTAPLSNLWQINSESNLGWRPHVCQTVLKFSSAEEYSFSKCDCDLFGNAPTGNHLEEKAGLDVSLTCPSIWSVSVALVWSDSRCQMLSLHHDRLQGGFTINHLPRSNQYKSLFHYWFHGGMCVCVKSWNFKGRMGKKTRLGCPRPDFITSCFFLRGQFLSLASEPGRKEGGVDRFFSWEGV